MKKQNTTSKILRTELDLRKLLARTLPLIRKFCPEASGLIAEIESSVVSVKVPSDASPTSIAMAKELNSILFGIDSTEKEKEEDTFTIRVKDHPEKYIGKKDSSYALKSDIQMQSNNFPLQLDAHWFVPRKYAKVWNLSNLRRFITYCSGRTNGSFSKFEVLRNEEVIDWEAILSDFNKRKATVNSVLKDYEVLTNGELRKK